MKEHTRRRHYKGSPPDKLREDCSESRRDSPRSQDKRRKRKRVQGASKQGASARPATTDKQGQADKRLGPGGIADTIGTRQAAYPRTVLSHDLAYTLDAGDSSALRRLDKGRGDSTVSNKDRGDRP
jgi:hypothetical protein